MIQYNKLQQTKVQQKIRMLNDQIMISCWEVVQQKQPKSDYLKQQKIIEWVNRVQAEKQIRLARQDISVEQQLHKFIKTVHHLQRDKITNVSFKYEEAVQFWNWFVDKFAKQQNDLQPKQNTEQPISLKQQHQKQQQTQNGSKLINKSTDLKQSKQLGNGRMAQKQQLKGEQQQQQQQEENYLYPHGDQAKDKQKDIAEHQNQFANSEEQNQSPNTPEQESKFSKNYKEYLFTIFEHYCRMSYATGSDPTFEQIQQKTQIMTINKFMVFCKEFGIVKLNNMTRDRLVQIFKKNAEFYKQMNFQQFMSVLIKISYLVYSSDSTEEQNQNSKEFQQFLLFLQVNNFNAFKKKIQSLNISYRVKANPKIQAKKAPVNYKFKFSVSNGKTEQQIKEQLEQRKRIRSQNKLKIFANARPKNMSSKKEITKIQHQLRDQNDRPQIRTTQPTKKLAPPLPPARKPSNSITNKPALPDPTGGVTGYANIHRLKLMGKQGQAQSKMKLNTVVEEAKRMLKLGSEEQFEYQYPASNRVSTHGRETPYSNLSSYSRNKNIMEQMNLDRDGMSHSSADQYSQRQIGEQIPITKRAYAAHGHSHLQKKAPKKQGNQQLNGIIGDDSDEDEYLEQHLNRQKKSGAINMNQRIQKKIKQYQKKVNMN